MFFPDDFATPFWRQHLTGILERMSEPSLFARRDEMGPGAARLVWVRAFHPPVVARLELGPEPFLIVKTPRSQSGPDHSEQLFERRIPLDAAVASRAVGAIRSALATSCPRDHAGRDGSIWLLERVGGGYRVDEADSASAAGIPPAFRAAAWHLIELAGPDVVEGPIY
jgi:hypothetical protein